MHYLQSQGLRFVIDDKGYKRRFEYIQLGDALGFVSGVFLLPAQ